MRCYKDVIWGIVLLMMFLPAVAQCAQAEVGKAAAKKPVNAKVIARGKYMVQTGHCNNCHTPAYTRNEGNVAETEWLTGSTPLGYRGPWGTTYASNLRLTVPKFSQEQWVKYVKVMRPRPPMPFWALRDTTDADLGAMYQYIVSIGAAGQPAPEFVPPDQEPKPPYEARRTVQ
jgi:mono/diheme cytochrome c family protein